MPQRTLTSILRPQRLALVALLGLGIVLRWQLVSIQTSDYRAFLDPWYTHLAENGGFAALRDSFSNYNTPYLVLLAALTYLPIPQLVGIKLISVVFDLVLAGFVYRIITQIRPGRRWLPVVGFGAAFLLPTVVLNSGAWAQCDSIYAALCAGSLSWVIAKRPWLACACFGLAFAFKLQAVFFLPALHRVAVHLPALSRQHPDHPARGGVGDRARFGRAGGGDPDPATAAPRRHRVVRKCGPSDRSSHHFGPLDGIAQRHSSVVPGTIRTCC